jgi:hypothetical protein
VAASLPTSTEYLKNIFLLFLLASATYTGSAPVAHQPLEEYFRDNPFLAKQEKIDDRHFNEGME